MRVWELARKLQVESKSVLAVLKDAGVPKKTASSNVTPNDVMVVEARLSDSGTQPAKVLDFDGRTGTGKVRVSDKGTEQDFDFDLKKTRLESQRFETLAVGKSVRAKLSNGRLAAIAFE